MGRMNDLGAAKVEVLLQTQAGGDVTGTGKDITKYEGVALFIFDANFTSGTATLDMILEESDAVGGTYTAVPGGAFTQVGAADATRTLSLNLDGRKAFIRAVADIGGGSPVYAGMCVFMVAFEKYQS